MQNPTLSGQTSPSWFNQHAPAPFKVNNRLAVRFIRHDIRVTLCRASTLELAFNKIRKNFPAQLIDISSRGVLITSDLKLNVNKKILLTLSFADNQHFQILGIIVRKEKHGPSLYDYGIRFDKTKHMLADYLVATQRVLTFR